MPTRIERQEASVDESTLAALEARLGISIPSEYRDHLLEHNGGKPVPSGFKFKSAHGSYSDSRVDWFLAVYDGEYDNFETYFQTYKVHSQRVPFDLVPIAHDDGGNLICISVEGVNAGKMYFWYHESEGPGDKPTRKNVHLIAGSFSEFLTCLE